MKVMYKFKTSILVFGALFVLSFPILSLAHGDGASYEEEVNGYLVDIGYSPKDPYVGGIVPFDFGLSKDGENVNFSDLWVRVSEGEKTIFAGGIYNADFGGARLSMVFPEKGEYTVSARYQNKGDEIVTAEFPIVIEPSGDTSSGFEFSQIVFIVLGVFAGSVGTLFIKRKKII